MQIDRATPTIDTVANVSTYYLVLTNGLIISHIRLNPVHGAVNRGGTYEAPTCYAERASLPSMMAPDRCAEQFMCIVACASMMII